MAARPSLVCPWFAVSLTVLLLALAAPVQAAAPQQQTCYNLVVNGGFETNSAWVLGPPPLPPTYIAMPRSGAQAMQLGNATLTPSIEAYSTVRQTVTLPANALSAEVIFWAWTISEPNPGNDRMEALLLVPGASVQSASPVVLWSTMGNNGGYQQIRVAVNGQIGRTLDLTFSVYNDGFGGRSRMLVDDVAVVVCLPSATSTPTPTFIPFPTATPTPTFIPFPTATPTPIPTVIWPSPIPPTCVDILANGDFEYNGAWMLGGTPIVPFYAGPPNPVFSGSRSMALGAVLSTSPNNVASYSSIQQAVSLPPTAQTAQIRFWYYPNSSAAPGGLNRQELILLDPLNYNQTIEVLWRVTQNSNTWTYAEIDLTRFLGRTVSVYFNARNAGDGTRTGMFLDQVQVLACQGAVVLPAKGALEVYGEAPPASGAAASQAVQSPPISPPAQAFGALAAAPTLQSPTIIAVGAQTSVALPAAPETTPLPATTTPEPTRREQGAGFNLDLLNSPWVIIVVVSLVVLVAAVAALLVFRDEGDKPSP